MTGSAPADPRARTAHPFRRIAGIVAVAALIALPLVSFKVDALGRALLDTGHYPLFALITVLAYRAARRGGLPPRLSGAAAAVVSVGAGVLVEALQSLTGRTASVGDLVADLAGTAVALAGIGVWGHGTRLAPRVAHGAAAIVVLGVLLIPAWAEWRALSWRNRSFPVLGDFEDPAQLRLWRTQGGTEEHAGSVRRSSDAARGEGHLLEVRTVEGDWGGACLNLGRMDWTPFAELQLQVFNPGEPFLLRVLVDDANTDDDGKYVLRTTVAAGWTDLRVPLEQIRQDRYGQYVDLTRVSSLRIFAGAKQPARVFYVDEIRLDHARANASR